MTQHEFAFVLSRAAATVQLYMFLPEHILGEEIEQTGDDRIGALADRVSLFDEVVVLLRHTLTADSKNTTLLGEPKSTLALAGGCHWVNEPVETRQGKKV